MAAAGAVARAGGPVLRLHRDPQALSDTERATQVARAQVIRHVMDAKEAAGCSIEDAVRALNAALADGTADESLVALIWRANARPRATKPPQLVLQTLHRWRRLHAMGGIDALAPLPTHHETLPPWAGHVLRLYRVPGKRSISEVMRKLPAELEGTGIAVPKYGAVRRFVNEKVGVLARNTGRMGPRELKTISPYVRRRTSHMWAGDVYTADGHRFKADVAHPAHGGPFRPEITTVLDVATRLCVGWSFALDENSHGVLEAQRRAFMRYGVCSIWYTDRGAGFDNKLQKDPIDGMAARLGFEVRHSLPYNSQARGLEERSHQSILVRAARELPTFVGKAMDREAQQRVYKLVRRDLKKAGVSPLLPSWDAFVAFIEQAIEDYNNTPHRGLDRVRGADGVLRHKTPREEWDEHIRNGATVKPLASEVTRDLFWPSRAAKVNRGQVRLFNKVYFHQALAECHGDVVRVCYDPTDPRMVIVRDANNGRWMCDAVLDGNVRDYFSESVLAEAARKRAEGRLRRLEVKREEIEQELAGSRVIEHDPSPRFDWGVVDAEADPVALPAAEEIAATPSDEGAASAAAQSAAPTAPTAQRPVFEWSRDRYEWLLANKDQWIEQDKAFLRHYVASEDYALLRETYEATGLAWTDELGKGFNAAG